MQSQQFFVFVSYTTSLSFSLSLFGGGPDRRKKKASLDVSRMKPPFCSFCLSSYSPTAKIGEDRRGKTIAIPPLLLLAKWCGVAPFRQLRIPALPFLGGRSLSLCGRKRRRQRSSRSWGNGFCLFFPSIPLPPRGIRVESPFAEILFYAPPPMSKVPKTGRKNADTNQSLS